MPDFLTLTTNCRKCGETATIRTTQFLIDFWKDRGEPYPYTCPKCEAEQDAEKRRKEDEEIAAERARLITENMKLAGVPEAYQVLLPPVPNVAAWIEKNIDRNILLHGYTGAGKSTSAGYHARMILSAGKRVKWYALASLLDEWREARKSDDPDATPRLFYRLESFDLVILDECDKPINTESTQECMFRLIEDVSNGVSRARLWMLGNFYRGSIEDIFGNGEAARRRFNENFACAQILQDGTIRGIKL